MKMFCSQSCPRRRDRQIKRRKRFFCRWFQCFFLFVLFFLLFVWHLLYFLRSPLHRLEVRSFLCFTLFESLGQSNEFFFLPVSYSLLLEILFPLLLPSPLSSSLPSLLSSHSWVQFPVLRHALILATYFHGIHFLFCFFLFRLLILIL